MTRSRLSITVILLIGCVHKTGGFFSIGKQKSQQQTKNGAYTPVPLFVMLQLDTVDPTTNRLKNPEGLKYQLLELQRAGVDGVMADVWWGIVEREGPKMYNWTGYDELVRLVGSTGLKLQCVMSFHQCGGNVGDACFIPLPEWVLEVRLEFIIGFIRDGDSKAIR